MSIIALPSNLKYQEFTFGVVDYEMEETADSTGDSAARILGPSRWTAHMTSNDDMQLSEASRWEVMTINLRADNVLALYDIVRKEPRGTMRGTPVLAAAIAVGATSCQITTSGTLLQSDWIGIGTGFGTSQLVKIMADASPSSGTLTVTFQNPARRIYASGTAIIWDKPVAYFRRMNKQATLGTYSNDSLGQGGFALDLMERFG